MGVIRKFRPKPFHIFKVDENMLVFKMHQATRAVVIFYNSGVVTHDCRIGSGVDFRTFFSAENHFPRNFPLNFEGKLFFKTFFRRKFQFSPTIFRGKISAEFSPEKMYVKIGS
jgi:hypothetical protein